MRELGIRPTKLSLQERKRSHFFTLSSSLSLALTAVVLVSCAGPSSESPFRPNVLILLVDALRSDALGVNGYPLPTSPVIDGLATEGINFSAAFAHSTWTKPSIATLFTSLYPGQHGMDHLVDEELGGYNTRVLPPEFETLAESFQRAGYSTAAVLNQVHLHPRFGFAQGFDVYDFKRGIGAHRINRLFRNWLDAGESEPFFAYLHYLDVHWPYTKRLPGQEAIFGTVERASEFPRRRKQLEKWAATEATEADVAILRARYDYEVAFTDAAIGEMLEMLRERGLYENTIILVTSDHGEGFLEHGKVLHGFEPYDEVVRVPLVFRLPERLRQGTGTVDQPVGLVDVMPTLLEIASIEPPPGLQGQSLVPLFKGGRMKERLIFAESAEVYADWDHRYKLMRFSDGRLEFYDLGEDPDERHPMTEDCSGPCRELAAQLRSYAEAMERAGALLAHDRAALRPEELEDLKALGYL